MSDHPPPLDAWLASLQSQLDDRKSAHLYRELTTLDSPSTPTIQINGKPYLQFSSNNYLGLATHPELIHAALEATASFGTGAGASRLVTGSMALHTQLEQALAKFKNVDRVLLFPSGFMANLAVLTTFCSKNDLIVSDKLNHASLLDAAAFSGATSRTFPHRNYPRAHTLLTKPRNSKETAPAQKFLVTDSLFSMDGDLADLPACSTIAQRTNSLLIIDEAHATGILGPSGKGVAELQNVEPHIAITIGTLSKALGSIGGFVAGPHQVIESLINAARPFIYTTALPPAACAAALAALKIIQREPERRQHLLHLARTLKTQLTNLGFNCGDNTEAASPILPILLGESDKALQAASFLRDRGIWVTAIRPPTVPPGTARLRISLMATHTPEQIERLAKAMRELSQQLLSDEPKPLT